MNSRNAFHANYRQGVKDSGIECKSFVCALNLATFSGWTVYDFVNYWQITINIKAGLNLQNPTISSSYDLRKQRTIKKKFD